MKKCGRAVFCWVFLILAQFMVSARAEVSLTLEPESLAAGSETRVTVSAPGAVDYTYALYRGEEVIFEGEPCPYASGYYRPREAGRYTLRVCIHKADGGTEEAETSFTVSGQPICHLAADKPQVSAGEALQITMDAQGGTGEYTYRCSVYLGNERIDELESGEAVFSYAPPREGVLRLVGQAIDTQGNAAQAEAVEVTVYPGAGIGVSGETGAFGVQGGYKTWEVHAPGIWTAETADDFILLDRACGADGDPLVIGMLPGEGTARRGAVTITSGRLSATFFVMQSADNGEEEEVSLDQTGEALLIDGQEQCAWMDAAGQRLFPISAPDVWTAECAADFVKATQTEAGLLLDVAENEDISPREAAVLIHCGTKTGYIFLSQPPKRIGCGVLRVALAADHGTAYQDSIAATVVTSADARTLTILSDAWREPMLFFREEAQESAEGLTWPVLLPLSGSGVQTYLFTASNEEGGGAPACAQVNVLPEPAGFAQESASLILEEEGARLTLRLTAAAEQVTFLDAQGMPIGTCAAQDAASIDRCVAGDSLGRYADWEIFLPEGEAPAYAQIGTDRIPIQAARGKQSESSFILYSQFDGWWQDKQYRQSNLQHSGCAIFALSHALQILGYTEDAILPQNLAQTYAFCLREGGTINDALIGHAGDDFGFKTRYALYQNLDEILAKMEQGAVFSFSVAEGHIAMVAAVSEDHTKFKIIDSAPSATFERIKGSSLYIETEAGFHPISALSEIPGIRYYIETGVYGGAEYWLDASYVAKRGVRLIQPENETGK